MKAQTRLLEYETAKPVGRSGRSDDWVILTMFWGPVVAFLAIVIAAIVL